MSTIYDVIIIGAGAAGLFCGSRTARHGKSVLILEHNKLVGRKIQISGGGKANFTNIFTTNEHYLSQNPHFVKSALSRYSPYEFLSLLDDYKIDYYEKKLGQYFCSKTAKDLINLLVCECTKYNCKIQTSTEVVAVEKRDKNYLVQTSQGNFHAKNCVIASGGLSVPPIGATDIGYKIGKSFGHKLIETYPSLVPYLLKDSPYAELSGISVDCIVFNNKASFRENILFTHKGISGPAILQISNYVEPGESFSINFLPELSESIFDHPSEIKNKLKKVFSKKFIDYIYTNINGFKDDHGNLSKSDIKNMSNFLFRFEITPHKTAGYIKAEVTKGGISTSEVSSKTMESNLSKGLYFIGEVLDITGHLGGFNFQWAWASANAASESLKNN